MSLVWTYKAWEGKLPSAGSDEYGRHTLVIPNPFTISEVYDGTNYHPAVVFVVAPWWFCRHIFSADYRMETKQMRRESHAAETEAEAYPA